MRSKYEFWLSYNNGAEKLQLPVNPDRLNVSTASQNESYMVRDLGEITIINDAPAKTFAIASQFPKAYFPSCEYIAIPDPEEAIATIERWKNSKNPIRFIVTGTRINYAVSIDSFNYNEQAGDVGTWYFDLALKEYKFIGVQELKPKGDALVVTSIENRPDNRVYPNTYTVKAGDTLSKIAKLVTGNSANWRKIATTNNLPAPYVLKVKQIIKIPNKSELLV